MECPWGLAKNANNVGFICCADKAPNGYYILPGTRLDYYTNIKGGGQSGIPLVPVPGILLCIPRYQCDRVFHPTKHSTSFNVDHS